MMLDAEGQSDGRSSNLEAVADHRGLHFGQSSNRLRPGLRFRLVGLSTVMAAQSSCRAPVHTLVIIRSVIILRPRSSSLCEPR